MDFKKVLTILNGEFNRQDIAFALIGGVALGLRGVPRSTVDIDFLIKKEDAAAVGQILRDFGFTCLYDSENVAQYTSELQPEDIIGLKIQAIANNPEREPIDKSDIEELLKIHGKEIGWNKLQRYFGMFEMEGWYEELKKRFD